MRIRFIHQYFHPDLASVSQIISRISFHLAARGDEVSVLCSRNRYDRSQDGGALAAREAVRGVDIRRCWGPSFGRGSLPGYFLDMASFCVLAGIRSMVMPKADTVVLLTNPPLFSALGAVLKKVRKERFVYVMMDVYPEIAVRAGVMRKGGAAERIARWISRLSLRRADRIVVLGDDMRDVAIREGAAPGNVVVIPNWADPEEILPVPPEENPLRREWGLEGKFVVEYSGNFGVSHSFDEILGVAGEVAGHEDLRFLFIGGGTRFREVERVVRERGLSNVVLLPYRDKSELSRSLSAGDVHYVSLRPGFEGLVVPSKAYGIMAAGRPVIYQGSPDGEIARMVIREGIGRVVPSGDRDGLREAILAVYRDRKAGERMGRSARTALEERYSAAKGLDLYRKVLSGGA